MASEHTTAHQNHQLGGYKAALHNDRVCPSTPSPPHDEQMAYYPLSQVSADAKGHAAEVIVESGKQLPSELDAQSHRHFHNEHPHEIVNANPLGLPQGDPSLDLKAAQEHEHHVRGGYKAALHNPNTSEEAKEQARQALAGSS
ncbi:hypothetical protein BD324DRAFT_648809 [Kockovaella imperatae]|uniref:Uncharacterized protein n=1 Tax=Kockovaella imperatae TaxID=4999 RepID=A0A1Y1UQH0_9TREE|nr:hypothetical protein BD324DRAFT_648809 [Kockovaella imperatae]ORX40212.1 hypothetical protein BD324DRAFT_648809 [Kockovaella imperatae]